jgi:hypothetical protein
MIANIIAYTTPKLIQSMLTYTNSSYSNLSLMLFEIKSSLSVKQLVRTYLVSIDSGVNLDIYKPLAVSRGQAPRELEIDFI